MTAMLYGHGVGNAASVSGLTASPAIIPSGVLFGRAIGGYGGKKSDLVYWTFTGGSLHRYEKKKQTYVCDVYYSGTVAGAVSNTKGEVWLVFYNSSKQNRPTFRKYDLFTGEITEEYEAASGFSYAPVKSSVALGSDDETVWLSTAARSGGSSSDPEYSTYTTRLSAGSVSGPLSTAIREADLSEAEICALGDGGCLTRAVMEGSKYADTIYRYSSTLAKSTYEYGMQSGYAMTQDPTSGNIFDYENTFKRVRKNKEEWVILPNVLASSRRGLMATKIGLLVDYHSTNIFDLYRYDTKAVAISLPYGYISLGVDPYGYPLFYGRTENAVLKINDGYALEEVFKFDYTPDPFPYNVWRLGNGLSAWATEA